MNNCRTCLGNDGEFKELQIVENIIEKILVLSSVDVTKDQSASTLICVTCIDNLNKFYEFREKIIEANEFFQDNKPSNLDFEKISTVCYEEEVEVGKSEEIENEEDENEWEISIKIPEDGEDEDSDMVETIFIESDERPIRKVGRRKQINYPCDRCSFIGSSSMQLSNHKRNRHSKVNCDICGRPVSLDNLSRHRKTHSADESVACKICGRVFKNMESYRSHPAMHIEETSICPVCGKVFGFRGEFFRHMASHKAKKRVLQCEHCQRTFNDRKSLQTHINSHTGARPFGCKFCKKNFTSATSLKTHTRLHTNEKPYTCSLCPMAFPQRISLRTHMQSKHDMPLPKDTVFKITCTNDMNT